MFPLLRSFSMIYIGFPVTDDQTCYLEAVLIRHELLGFPLIDCLCGAPWRLRGSGSSTGPVSALRQVEVRHLDADLVTHDVLELEERKGIGDWQVNGSSSSSSSSYYYSSSQSCWENRLLPAGRCFGWACPLWRRCKRVLWTFPAVSLRIEKRPYFHPANS